jgi:hypothetical protein
VGVVSSGRSGTTEKESYARWKRIAPSARLEAQIEELLRDELAANSEKPSWVGWERGWCCSEPLKTKMTAFLGRASYQRTPEAAG